MSPDLRMVTTAPDRRTGPREPAVAVRSGLPTAAPLATAPPPTAPAHPATDLRAGRPPDRSCHGVAAYGHGTVVCGPLVPRRPGRRPSGGGGRECVENFRSWRLDRRDRWRMLERRHARSVERGTPSAAPSGEQSVPAEERRTEQRLRPRVDQRHRQARRLAVVRRRERGPQGHRHRVRGPEFEDQGRLLGRRGRLPDGHGDELRLEERPGPVLRRRLVRPDVGRPGLPGAARRLHRRSPASTPARSSPATWPRSRAATARSTVCRRTATRSGWPTTPPTSRPPRRRIDELVTAAQALKGKDGLKAPMCLNASLDRGLAFIYADGGAIVSDDGRPNMVEHARDEGRRPVVSRPVQERARHDRQRPRRRLVRRLARQGPRRDRLRGRLARPGHDEHVSRRSSTPGATFPTGTSGSPMTISYTAAYAIGADSQNKDQAWVLLEYLAGRSRHDEVDVGRRRPAVPLGRSDAGRQGRPRRAGAGRQARLRAS